MASRKARARRVDRVLDVSRRLDRPLGIPARAAVVAGALSLAWIAAAASPAVRGTADPLPSPAMCGGKAAYGKWLNEDAAYIIKDSERREFTALKTEQACKAFIEQFWHGRDKVEHYRRIAYANERFASGVPGWKTDRGRIYIKHGPPDEIESHPEIPAETWRYRPLPATGAAATILFRLSTPVMVDPDRTVQIVLPVDPAGEAVSIHGRIVNRSRRTVMVFEDMVHGSAGVYRKRIDRPLEPGSYELFVTVKRGDSVITEQQSAFEVK